MALDSTNKVTFTFNDTGTSQYINTGIDAAKLDTKADYTSYASYSDSTSTADGLNYGTTHDIKIKGNPIVANTIEVTDIPSLNQINSTWSLATKEDVDDAIEKLRCEINKKVDKAEINEMKKENDTMMKGFNFDFGPCGSTVRMSMYGMAIQNIAGEWVSYNLDSGEIVNVDVFNMPDGGKYMYKMPVAIKDVKAGDIVIHNRVPMFVTKVNGKTFEVTDVRAGEAKTIIPATNMFGFNFLTKVVSMFGSFGPAPTADNPFGNMLPLIMMSEGKDIDLMMLMFMMGGQGANMFSNPMMMYFLMKDKDIDPMLMFMMMNNNGIAPVTEG